MVYMKIKEDEMLVAAVGLALACTFGAALYFFKDTATDLELMFQ